MDEITKATVAAIRTKIPDLETAALGPEYSYHSLPLCVIDAVFSIGVRYRNVQNAVESWCVAQKPNWPKYSTVAQARHTITDLIQVTNGYDGVALAQTFFGGNRQRTSSQSGILKADAVVRFAKALQEARVEDFPDIRDAARAERASQAVRSIPGQGSGLSFDYLLMLAGDDSYVKPDRMLCWFVAEAAGRPDISPHSARDAVVAACRDLAREFPNLTPRLLDHLIWSYQRAQPRPDRGTRGIVDEAGLDPCERPRPARS
jgi:hypothetical protein